MVTLGDNQPSTPIITFLDDSLFPNQSSKDITNLKPNLSRPIAYNLIYVNIQNNNSSVCIWSPVAPNGYRSMGCVVVVDDLNMPDFNSCRCLREDLCEVSNHNSPYIWHSKSNGDGGSDCTLWLKSDDLVRGASAIRGLNLPSSYQCFVPSVHNFSFI